MPRLQAWGGSRRSFVGAGEGRGPLPSLPMLRGGILIAIGALDQVTIFGIDPLNLPLVGLDIEEAALAYLHPSDMDAHGLERGRHHRSDAVARLEPPHLLVPHQIATREPVLVPVRAAMAPPTCCHDGERFELARPNSRKLSYTQSVEGVRLLDPEPCPVPPRAPAAPGADGHPEDTQGLHQFVSGCVDRCCIFEGSLGLVLHLRMPPFGSGLVPFGLVALLTTQTQVRDPIQSAPAPGPDVVELERRVGLPTIGAAIHILAEQIGTDFPSGQRAVLVCNPLNFRMLQQLGVEADALHFNAREWCPTGEAGCPADHVADTREQGGRQPAPLAPPVQKAGSAMPQIGASASASGVGLLLFGPMHLLSPMADLREQDSRVDFSLLSFLYPGQRHAAGPAARIDFERQRLQRAVLHAPVPQSDDKGAHAMDHRSPMCKQEASPFGRARHEWLFVSV